MLANRCAACLLLTTTGRILVQWELDATLPLRYAQLALLVASLVQFSKAQDFCELELSNGHTLVVRSDAAAQLSCVVVCATGSAERKQTQKALDMAHLKSLVILTEFLRCYRDDVEALVEASRASVEDMAEKYTLTSALAGGDPHRDGHYDHFSSSDADGTLDAFVAFQNDFVAPMIEDNSAENIRTGISDSVAHVSAAPVEITRQFLIHADSGRLLYSLMAAPKILSQHQSRHRCVEESLPTQQLLSRLARALGASFPILQRTSLLTRSRRDSNVGFANSSVSSTTIVLRLQDATEAAATGLHIAVQMLSTGTFASVVFFYGASPSFLGHASELVRTGDLQRVLIADARGGQLLALVQEGTVGSEFQLHVGSDGAPPCVLEALENIAAPWTRLFDAPA